MLTDNQLSFTTTADGSKTLWNEQVGEHYHSAHGALQESRHVFVEAGLQHYLKQSGANEINILEVGFGTGLNFLLTADYCLGSLLKLKYTGVEAYPLTHQLINNTGYQAYVNGSLWDAFIKNYAVAMQHPIDINNLINLEIVPKPLLKFESADLYDIIYFDAFASARQPEMWNEEAIAHTVKFLRSGGIFVTYAITGNLKRMLKTMSFKIEKVPGALGKREMLRATKQ